jgi:hypothetical protein
MSNTVRKATSSRKRLKIGDIAFRNLFPGTVDLSRGTADLRRGTDPVEPGYGSFDFGFGCHRVSCEAVPGSKKSGSANRTRNQVHLKRVRPPKIVAESRSSPGDRRVVWRGAAADSLPARYNRPGLSGSRRIGIHGARRRAVGGDHSATTSDGPCPDIVSGRTTCLRGRGAAGVARTLICWRWPPPTMGSSRRLWTAGCGGWRRGRRSGWS